LSYRRSPAGTRTRVVPFLKSSGRNDPPRSKDRYSGGADSSRNGWLPKDPDDVGRRTILQIRPRAPLCPWPGTRCPRRQALVSGKLTPRARALPALVIAGAAPECAAARDLSVEGVLRRPGLPSPIEGILAMLRAVPPEPADPTPLYHEAAELYSDAARPIIASLRSVDLVPEFKAAEIVSRGVVCRQHDYLEVAITLADAERGWAVLSLVRPAAEELIWLSALCDVPPTDRDALVLALVATGGLKDVTAQIAFAGDEFARSVGLDAIERDLKEGQGRARADVKRILASIGLEVKRGATPSVRAVAKRGGQLELYDFLYHASSTAVHFRPDQIMRGIWGSRDHMRFDLRPVERARAAFALFWSLWLARETLRVGLPLCGDVEIPPPPTEALCKVEELLSQAGYPQFIYPEEFNRRPPRSGADD
jgi:hypothetical protein